MQDPSTALYEFGYSPNEARFLSLVTAHSGYFLRRQYYTYYNRTTGRPATLFLTKLLGKKHAACYHLARGPRVYHIYSRTIYAALGREHVRFRKDHCSEYIKTKLLALEFVIQNKDFTYLTSEKEKINYFIEHGIDRQFLPATTYKAWNHSQQTTRYFVDKFPLFLGRSTERASIICFTFIDPGFCTIESFISHLRKYQALFSKLKEFKLIYIASHPRNLKPATDYFSKYVSSGALWAADPNHYSHTELLRFFELQWHYDEKHFEVFTPEVIDEYRIKRARFASEKFMQLYRQFRAGYFQIDNSSTEESSKQAASRVRFEAFLVPKLDNLFCVEYET